MRLKDTPMLCAVVAIGALVAAAGEINAKPELVWIFKPLTTAVIAWAAWRRGALANRYAQFIFLGLLVSLLADIALAAPLAAGWGLALYGLAHLAYGFAFTADAGDRRATGLALAAMGLQAAALAWWWPSLPQALALAGAFAAIAASAAFALAYARMSAMRSSRSPQAGTARLAVVGTGLFIVALLMALAEHGPMAHALAPAWILFTYWAAQTLIALSVPLHPQRVDDSEGVAAPSADGLQPGESHERRLA